MRWWLNLRRLLINLMGGAPKARGDGPVRVIVGSWVACDDCGRTVHYMKEAKARGIGFGFAHILCPSCFEERGGERSLRAAREFMVSVEQMKQKCAEVLKEGVGT